MTGLRLNFLVLFMRLLLCTNPAASEIDFLASSLIKAGASSVSFAWDLTSAIQGASEGIDLVASDRFQFIFPDWFLGGTAPVAVNTHMSLLPRHRGTQALFFCTLLGDRHGWTIHMLDAGIDTGPILLQEGIEYSEDKSFRDVHSRTRAEIVNGLCRLVSTAPEWFAKSFPPQPILDEKAHRSSVFVPLFSRLPLGWDTSIKDARFLLRDFVVSRGIR